jgi:phosphoribosylformylglycinamidine (FGAM) synthase-like enzyme
LKKPRDYTADLKKLLASANICDKRWVFEQYDSMVQTNTVQGPGGEAGVMRIKGTQRGLAMALAGNGRWTYLDPKLGAMHAVAEAARKVACTGATPVAATNCLNFGNPEKPEIMAQLSQAIDGIAEACIALGTPVTGGNVSLYNETKGEGIYPTPVLGVVGIIEDVRKAVPAAFQRAGDDVLLLFSLPKDLKDEIETLTPANIGSKDKVKELVSELPRNLGSTEFAKMAFGTFWGRPCSVDLEGSAQLNNLLVKVASERLVHSAADVCDGGLPVALARCGFANNIGCEVRSEEASDLFSHAYLFLEDPTIVVSCAPENTAQVLRLATEAELGGQIMGCTVEGRLVMSTEDSQLISASLDELRSAYSSALESQLAAEVVTA